MISSKTRYSGKFRKRKGGRNRLSRRLLPRFSGDGIGASALREYGLRTGKQRPIDNRFAGAQRQPPPMLGLPAIASRSCLGKRYSATLATKSTACFRSAVERPRRLGRTRVGTPMVQSMIFGIVLYLTPSVLLLALLTCREEFDYRPEEWYRVTLY
jgi:hypothetical protein